MGMQYAAAVLRGQRHLLNGQPCQDCAAGSAEGPTAVAVLCDGAGSCPQSEKAAECVCQWALASVPGQFEDLWAMEPEALANALTVQGQTALREAGQEDGLCTMLLFACHKDGRWFAAHIGDGDLFLREDSVRVLSYPENGYFANETYFLCEPCAREHLRVCQGRASGAFQVLLTSDGCGGALYDRQSKTPAPAVDVLCGWLAVYDSETVSKALARQLAERFSTQSRDDLSLALLSDHAD